MAKKSELEAAYSQCGDLSHQAARAAARHDYRSALALAARCLPRLSDELNYQRRFLKPDRFALPPADLILRFAPPLFARRPLDELAEWVAGLSKAERSAVPELPGRLAEARQRLATAVRLWSDLDRPIPHANSDAALLRFWVAAGLVEPAPGQPAGHRRVTDL